MISDKNLLVNYIHAAKKRSKGDECLLNYKLQSQGEESLNEIETETIHLIKGINSVLLARVGLPIFV